MKERRVSPGQKRQSQGNGVDLSLTETPKNGRVNLAYQHDATMSDSDSDTGGHINTQASHSGDEDKATHSIILDISTTSFVDTVAVKTMKNVCAW